MISRLYHDFQRTPLVQNARIRPQVAYLLPFCLVSPAQPMPSGKSLSYGHQSTLTLKKPRIPEQVLFFSGQELVATSSSARRHTVQILLTSQQRDMNYDSSRDNQTPTKNCTAAPVAMCKKLQWCFVFCKWHCPLKIH